MQSAAFVGHSRYSIVLRDAAVRRDALHRDARVAVALEDASGRGQDALVDTRART
jgi:hypothetical protein